MPAIAGACGWVAGLCRMVNGCFSTWGVTAFTAPIGPLHTQPPLLNCVLIIKKDTYDYMSHGQQEKQLQEIGKKCHDTINKQKSDKIRSSGQEQHLAIMLSLSILVV